MRHQVARNIQKIQKQQQQQNQAGHNNTKNKHELRLVKQIKEKLSTSNAVVARADKGHSIVIMYRDTYEQKVTDFISESGATETNNHTTKRFQSELRRTLNECKQVVDNSQNWKYGNMNPDTPALRGLVKIRKSNTPIRPVVVTSTHQLTS
jgi:hypothetical protein